MGEALAIEMTSKRRHERPDITRVFALVEDMRREPARHHFDFADTDEWTEMLQRDDPIWGMSTDMPVGYDNWGKNLPAPTQAPQTSDNKWYDEK